MTEDDIHDGYYIPKGTLVIPNIWFVLLFYSTSYFSDVALIGTCFATPGPTLNPTSSSPSVSSPGTERRLKLTPVLSASVLGDGRFSLAVSGYSDDLSSGLVFAQVNRRSHPRSALKADWIYFLDR